MVQPATVGVVAGLAGLLVVLACGAPEARDVRPSAIPHACALVSQEDVAEVFGQAVAAGEPLVLGEATYCTFNVPRRLAGTLDQGDGRIAIAVTGRVGSFARNAFSAGSAGQKVVGLGDRAAFNDDMLVVLQGSTLYESHVSGFSSDDAKDAARHVALARRALARLPR